jgi:hypothetical protein
VIEVTVSDAIASAGQTIADAVSRDGLAGLVNNAGIYLGGPLEFSPMDGYTHPREGPCDVEESPRSVSAAGCGSSHARLREGRVSRIEPKRRRRYAAARVAFASRMEAS